MSLIIYHNGQLAADRLGQNVKTPYARAQEVMVKLHVHPSKKFALAYCGYKLDDWVLESAMELLRIHLEIREMRRVGFEVKLPEDIPKLPDIDCTAIVLTHDSALYMDVLGSMSFSTITSGRLACGNGAQMGYVCLEHGLTPREAVLKTAEISHDVGLGVDSIEMSDLLSFDEKSPPIKKTPASRPPRSKKK